MTRITPEQVQAAYQATGLTPTRGVYLGRSGERDAGGACGLGALAYAGLGMDWAKKGLTCNRAISQVYGLSLSYQDGFIVGFDGLDNEPDIRSQAYQDGYADGAAAALAVGLPLSLTPSPIPPHTATGLRPSPLAHSRRSGRPATLQPLSHPTAIQ